MNDQVAGQRGVATAAFVQRRESDPRLREAARKVREAFRLISKRQLVADGVVIIALAEALAAVDSALGEPAGSEEREAA